MGRWRPKVASAEDVQELIRWPEPNVFIFDVREDKRGKVTKDPVTAPPTPIPNTLAIPLEHLRVAMGLPPWEFQEEYLRAKPQRADEIICVSYDGEDAELAAVLLRIAGYDNVSNCRAGTRGLFGEDLYDNDHMSAEELEVIICPHLHHYA